MTIQKIRDIVSKMTLDEKASMCSGADFWHTEGVERLGILQTMVTDGPHGLRKQEAEADHLGLNDSIEAVCFPAGCATAASFDRELLKKQGEVLGNECQSEDISVILGPAVNIKRSPLCGRNFEYYSEDPLLATEMAGALIEGIQSQNVGTSIKHFLANNQEYRRMTSSSQVDERTLREIYLAAFEGAVKQAKPWTVMCSYNKINGVFASENKTYLTDVLRDEWGFDGYVVSDWMAVNERVPGLVAGLDLEMPGNGGQNDALIIEAVKNGTLDEKIVNQACERILNIVFRYQENRNTAAVWDKEADHALAAKIEEECIVLLKNEDRVLPIKEHSKVAFIGCYAKAPRYQGGGSSHINSFKVTSALEASADMTGITYVQGFRDRTDEIDEALKTEALEVARNAEVAVIFAGLPENFESEGYDRKHMDIPVCQKDLIESVAAIQPNTVVVLHNGSPVEMPWIDKVKGVVEAYLGGQAVGSAVVNILFGKANPCGRLPETFPIQLQDNPSYFYYQGEDDIVEYREGVFVGYRYYESKNMEVLFPFGHGLSYTTFEYCNLKLDRTSMKDDEQLTVSVDVKNTGSLAGKEVIQLYVSPKGGHILRPVKELRAFDKISLEPGETKTVTFTLDKRAFAYWNTTIHDWHVESGEYEIQIAKSAHHVILSKCVCVKSTVEIPKKYTMNSTLGEVLENPKAQPILASFKEQMGIGESSKTEGAKTESSNIEDSHIEKSVAVSDEMMNAMMNAMPLRSLISFSPDLTREKLQKMVDMLNE